MCVHMSHLLVAYTAQFSCFATMTQAFQREAWLSASPGRLSAWQQARAFALREASWELHGGKTQLEWIAARVEKVGGGHPGRSALCQFFQTVDNDAEWYPGKCGDTKRGRKPLLTAAKRHCIAQSAMAAKKQRGSDPCVAAAVHSCPRATLNPETRQSFCDKTIRKVFAEDCYDLNPHFLWKLQCPLQKVFLPLAIKEHRLRMANHLLTAGPNTA